MCRNEVPTTVWLHVGGRSFYCPVCKHSRRHPPSDPELWMEGHVCCEVCWTFMRIVGVSEPLARPARGGAAAGTKGRGATE